MLTSVRGNESTNGNYMLNNAMIWYLQSGFLIIDECNIIANPSLLFI